MLRVSKTVVVVAYQEQPRALLKRVFVINIMCSKLSGLTFINNILYLKPVDGKIVILIYSSNKKLNLDGAHENEDSVFALYMNILLV